MIVQQLRQRFRSAVASRNDSHDDADSDDVQQALLRGLVAVFDHAASLDQHNSNNTPRQRTASDDVGAAADDQQRRPKQQRSKVRVLEPDLPSDFAARMPRFVIQQQQAASLGSQPASGRRRLDDQSIGIASGPFSRQQVLRLNVHDMSDVLYPSVDATREHPPSAVFPRAAASGGRKRRESSESVRPALDVKEDLVRPRAAAAIFSAPRYAQQQAASEPAVHKTTDGPAVAQYKVQYEGVTPTAPAAVFPRAPRWAPESPSDRANGGDHDVASRPDQDGSGKGSKRRFPGPQVCGVGGRVSLQH